MALLDGVVVGVGFVDGHEDVGELCAVVGDFEDVVLGVADEVGDEVPGDFGGGTRLGLLGGLDRSEEVVEFLLALGDEVGGGPGRCVFHVQRLGPVLLGLGVV